MKTWWGRVWPTLLAVATVTAVGGPAAVASYRHQQDVAEKYGDPVMAPWLPFSVDGMLVAALVVMWVRRRRGESAGWLPWLSFGLGMAATIGANLADAQPSLGGYVVALWPPVALALTMELVALVASRTAGADSETAVPDSPVPDGATSWVDPWDRWGVPTETAVPDRADTPVSDTPDRPVLQAVPDTPDMAADQQGPGETDPLLPQVIEWAQTAGLDTLSQRAVRTEFGVGGPRSARLVREFEEAVR